MGFKSGEIVGRHFSHFYPADAAAAGKPRQLLQRAIAEGECHDEVICRHKDGTPYPASVTMSAQFDRFKQHAGFAVVVLNMSAIRRHDEAKRRPTRVALHASEARYRILFDHAQIGIVLADAESCYIDANACACRMLGYSRDEFVGLHASDIVAKSETEAGQIDAALSEIAGQSEHRREWQFRRKDGSVFLGDVIATRMPDGTLLGLISDISVLKEREHEIARLSRLYSVLSQINQAIVWSPSRDELFRRVCRALVEHGGFGMAWIGWHDAATHRLVPVAESGDENGYLQSIHVYADNRLEGRGPSGLAFRSGRPTISNNLMNDPSLLPWRSELQRRGFRASASFPIRLNGDVCGTLTIHVDTQDFFHDKEIALLEEAATEVSFALDNFARAEARRQAEQLVHCEKLFSDTMIESLPGILYFYDSNGRFLRWNRTFEIVSGYSFKEITRMHPRDFFSAAEQPRVEQRIGEVFEKGEASVEASFVAKNGTAKPYYFTGRRIQFEGMMCLVGVGIDISERRRAENRLAESEQKYRELVENANCIILRWNADGHITFLNEFGRQFFGYAAEEILGRHVMDTIVPPSESSGRDLIRLMEEIRATPEAFEQNVNENVRRNGERVWIAWTNRFVRNSEGHVAEILSIGTDISDRMQIEAEREKRHRAEAADRIKSAFLATMSHELRTPLNSIIGFTVIFLQGLAGPLNPEQSKQLDMVRKSARHLLALVNDVLDISKIEAGQLEVARERFDVLRSVNKVLALIAPQIEAKRLTLRVQLAPGLGEAVSDERRFEQILLNLLSNAIKFTDHGAVTLTAESVADFKLPSTASGQAAIRLRVSDTGMGIKAEDLQLLFQPFRQVDSGLSRNHDGTGLGLAICRRLAQLMGGEIGAESEWGKGSTFTVTLPLEGPVKA